MPRYRPRSRPRPRLCSGPGIKLLSQPVSMVAPFDAEDSVAVVEKYELPFGRLFALTGWHVFALRPGQHPWLRGGTGGGAVFFTRPLQAADVAAWGSTWTSRSSAVKIGCSFFSCLLRLTLYGWVLSCRLRTLLANRRRAARLRAARLNPSAAFSMLCACFSSPCAVARPSCSGS